jgi:hypothetical protein
VDQFDANLSTGTVVTLDGYGFANVAMTVEGQLVTAQTPYQTRNATEFLAGAASPPQTPDTCLHDSGSPVYLTVGGTMYVIGITSRGTSPKCGTGGIYTILGAYDDWLQTNTGGAYPPGGAGDAGVGPGGAGDAGVGDDAGAGGGDLGSAGCKCGIDRASIASGFAPGMGLGLMLFAVRRRRQSRPTPERRAFI